MEAQPARREGVLGPQGRQGRWEGRKRGKIGQAGWCGWATGRSRSGGRPGGNKTAAVSGQCGHAGRVAPAWSKAVLHGGLLRSGRRRVPQAELTGRADEVPCTPYELQAGQAWCGRAGRQGALEHRRRLHRGETPCGPHGPVGRCEPLPLPQRQAHPGGRRFHAQGRAGGGVQLHSSASPSPSSSGLAFLASPSSAASPSAASSSAGALRFRCLGAPLAYVSTAGARGGGRAPQGSQVPRRAMRPRSAQAEPALAWREQAAR